MMYFHKIPIATMVDITQYAVSVKEKTTVYFPQTDTEAEITGVNDLIEEYEGQKVYCVEGKILAFIVNEILFVIPATEDRIAFLRDKEGFKKASFSFVPFSDGSQPSYNKKLWQELLDAAGYPG